MHLIQVGEEAWRTRAQTQMRLLDFGSFVAALSIAEWFVWAALAVLFGKQALVIAMRVLRWSTVAFASALLVLVTVAFVAASH
jgi:hypothetical protein